MERMIGRWRAKLFDKIIKLDPPSEASPLETFLRDLLWSTYLQGAARELGQDEAERRVAAAAKAAREFIEDGRINGS